MGFTPAHIAMARGNSRANCLQLQDMIRIRKFCLEKRFKNCIIACDELLKSTTASLKSPRFGGVSNSTNLHPVHRAFLIFHQAISHESLGVAAHKYSQNKINFLESAKDQFKAALDVLPQPFANENDGTYRTPEIVSPDMYAFANNSDSSYYPDITPQPQRTISETPALRITDVTRSPSEESFDSATSGTTVSATYTVPDFDMYSSRGSFANQHIHKHPSAQVSDCTPSGRPQELPKIEFQPFEGFSSEDEDENENTQVSTWLPRSMRSLNLAAHTLKCDSNDETSEEDTAQLFPSERIPTPSADESLHIPMHRSSSHTSRLSASLSTQHNLSPDLVPSPLFSKTKKLSMISFDGVDESVAAPRALPRTPNSHLTHLTLLPARKTAVQTLISKFEGRLPLPDTPSTYTTVSSPVSATTQAIGHTPITPRFDMLSDAFDSTPTQTHLKEYLTSRSLAQYNSNLAAFRTCLLSAYEHVENMLETAHAIQNKHDEDKRASTIKNNDSGMPKKRLASLWLLGTPGKPRKTRPRMSIIVESSSVSQAKMLGRSESLRGRKKLPLRNRVEESEEKRAERIEKLRQNGFRVYKEHHGWKGVDHYEGFRRRVEIDLAT